MKPTAMVYRAPPVFQATGGPMADFKHRRDRGIVRFSGELNLAAAVDLVETVDLLTRVYFYDLIEIQISSLGGVSTALEHYSLRTSAGAPPASGCAPASSTVRRAPRRCCSRSVTSGSPSLVRRSCITASACAPTPPSPRLLRRCCFPIWRTSTIDSSLGSSIGPSPAAW